MCALVVAWSLPPFRALGPQALDGPLASATGLPSRPSGRPWGSRRWAGAWAGPWQSPCWVAASPS
eukprot:4470895-Alexandrium_andersonii.AAC.1